MFEKKIVTLDHRMDNGMSAVSIQSDGAFLLEQDGKRIRRFHSGASVRDGRKIDTRTASRVDIREEKAATPWGEGKTLTTVYEENGLTLEQRLTLIGGKKELIASIAIHDAHKETESNDLSVLDAVYPAADEEELFRSLDQRMLLAPYDNDMWVRWEAAPLRPGRTSYDVSALFDEQTRNGLVLGALDHDVWKNGVRCSSVDARCVIACCGIADACTHDFMPHGTMIGEWVESSRFLVGWYDDVRDGLETFGDFCAICRPAVAWKGSVPFGWNSYSGVGHTTLECWEAAADVLQELQVFRDDEGVQYINLDAAFGLDAQKRKALVQKLHERGQKCGTYGGPFLYFPQRDENLEVPGSQGVKFSEMTLRDAEGRNMPAVDGLYALDCTHPAWEGYARDFIRGVAKEGFDYLKIDFLGHGSMEAKFADPSIRTGRQAYCHGMGILLDELLKQDHPIFLSLSIAPIFPYGFGHARRCCCDSFGHIEDVSYVLNALNFGWWTNGRLYALNDPDHIALYNSVIDGRGPTLMSEARSRYNSAVISGTVMLLSDNFGPDCSKELAENSIQRVREITCNAKLNELARSKAAFRPVELGAETCPVYTAKIGGKYYAAFFNFRREPQTISLEAQRGGIPAAGKVTDLNRDIRWQYTSVLSVALEPMDSAIVEIE